MRAARFHRFGGPELLRVEEIPSPVLLPGHVRVQVRAAAMNHLDLWIRRGLPIDTTMPHIGGSDIAGVVAEAAPDVKGWETGAPVVINPILFCGRCEQCLRGEESMCRDFRILGEHTDGGFADEVVVPAYTLHQIPEDFPFEVAAALGGLDHVQGDAVLDRAARVLALELEVELAGAGVEAAGLDDGGVGDEVEDGIVDGHGGPRRGCDAGLSHRPCPGAGDGS